MSPRSASLSLLLALLLSSSATSAPVMRLSDMLSPPFKPFDANGANFDILSHLLTSANLTSTLVSMRGYTLFAPSDSAFMRAAHYFAGCHGTVSEAAAFRAIIRQTGRGMRAGGGDASLREMLLNHVVQAPVTARMLMRRPSVVTTLADGGKATIINAGTGELVDASPRTPNAIVVNGSGDVFLADGVIVHVVDAVLLPVPANAPTQSPPCM